MFNGSSEVSEMRPRRRLLVIEDDPTDEMLTLKALRKAAPEADIVVAHDGLEAMRALKLAIGLGTLPNLVLLDLKLPRMDGYEVLEKIRATPETADLPVVVFSSSDEPSDTARCRDL